jgi:hypothetical protein
LPAIPIVSSPSQPRPVLIIRWPNTTINTLGCRIFAYAIANSGGAAASSIQDKVCDAFD